MGLFSKDEEVSAYERVRLNLAEKDGNTHVVMINTYHTWTTTILHCNEGYTADIDSILQGMQSDGFEIINVQHASMSNGTGLGVVTITSLITYR